MMSTTELAQHSGATIRQLDFWIRSGVLTPEVQARGSGTSRRFDPAWVPVVRLLSNIQAAMGSGRSGGVPTRLLARIVDNYGYGRIELAPNIHLTWEIQR